MQDYGPGSYNDGLHELSGNIRVDDARIYLSNGEGYPLSFIPLAKIEYIAYVSGGLKIKAKLAPTNIIRARLKLSNKARKRLTKDLVKRLNLKKKFLRRQWMGQPVFR